jgi:hypothetical protein
MKQILSETKVLGWKMMLSDFYKVFFWKNVLFTFSKFNTQIKR